jgi:hypothetical protein
MKIGDGGREGGGMSHHSLPPHQKRKRKINEEGSVEGRIGVCRGHYEYISLCYCFGV